MSMTMPQTYIFKIYVYGCDANGRKAALTALNGRKAVTALNGRINKNFNI